jgi:hypothetical protein
VQVSETTCLRNRDVFEAEPRGTVELKGGGLATTYLIRRHSTPPLSPEEGVAHR